MDGPVAAALAVEYGAVTEAVSGLSVGAFSAATRLPGWTVGDLLFHLAQDARRARADLATRPAGPADVDAVSYWRTYDPAGQGATLRDLTSREARRRYPTPAGLIADWLWWSGDTLPAVERRGGDELVETQDHVMTVEDLVRTLVVEATVHGDDLAAALGADPWSTAAGLEITKETLLGLLGAPLPATVGWDDLTLLRKGTGRTPLTEGERQLLGSAVDRFPLLC